MIAVIMSVYRGDRLDWLQQALESVLAQTRDDFLIFLMADGPVHPEVEAYLSALQSPRFQYLRRPENRGLAQTLNELIDLVVPDPRFSYLARMDADDICYPGRFAEQVAYLESHPEVDVLGGWCEEVDEGGRQVFLKKMKEDHDTLKRCIVLRNPFNHPTVMIRRRVFEAGYRYPTRAFLAEDYALWIELVAHGYIFANIPKVLLKFRITGNFFEKRRGVKRAIADVNIKSYAIICLDAYTLTNMAHLLSNFVMRVLPASWLKVLYYKTR
jgi:glycosyltransferase involved in cell wall biosynthesis